MSPVIDRTVHRGRTGDVVWLILRSGLAFLYLYTGALKVVDPRAFATALENYRLLSPSLVFGFALLVPWLEIVCGVALFARPWRVAAWCLAAALGIGFSVFVISAWWRGLDVSCGCFGSDASRIGPVATARALGLLALAVAGWWRDVTKGSC